MPIHTKYLQKLFFIFSLLSCSTFSYAGIPPHADLYIYCDSIGTFYNGKINPDLRNKRINLIFKPFVKKPDQRSSTYQLTVSTFDINNDIEISKKQTNLVDMSFYPSDGKREIERFFATPIENHQEKGRFTSYNLPISDLSQPFLIYGWSTEPNTSPVALEYRCKIEGVID